MDLERFIQRSMSIQAVPAPTFAEERRADHLFNEFRQCGLEQVEMDPAGNVYARVLGGDKPPLIVTAHLDTVFSADRTRPARRHNGRLIGPGIGDNAIALAALVELAFDLQKIEMPGDVWLVGNVGEEGLGNLLGMQHVLERFGSKVSGYVVVEGMALGHIYHRALPVRRFRLTARAPGGHSWIHAGRISAIHALIDLGNRLLGLPLSAKPRTTLNIGMISGGTSINTLAEEAYLELDIRSESEVSVERLVDQVKALMESARSPDLELELEPIGHRPSGNLPRSHPLVKAALTAFRRVGQLQPNLSSGSTDASLPLSLGLPAVCVGLTSGGSAHSQDEFIEIEPLEAGYSGLYELVLLAFEQDGLGEVPA